MRAALLKAKGGKERFGEDVSCSWGVWRNGSASDPRSEGWEFESLSGDVPCPSALVPRRPLGVLRFGRAVPATAPDPQQSWISLAPAGTAFLSTFSTPRLSGLLWELTPGPLAP